MQAGFAEALNIPVICCCKESDIKELHFDVNHLKQIVCASTEELKNKLIKFIVSCGLSANIM